MNDYCLVRLLAQVHQASASSGLSFNSYATVAEERELARDRDEAIMRDEDLARHAFHQIGAYDGPSIFLYDEHGGGIRHRRQLDRILDESENPWIVPADVHY